MPLGQRNCVPESVLLSAVDVYSQGSTLRAVSKRFGIAVTTLRRALKNYTTLGEVRKPPSNDKGGSKPEIYDEASEVLKSLLEARPQMYLRELRCRLMNELGVKVDVSTICRWLRKSKITRKRASRKAAQRSELLRTAYMEEVSKYSPEQLCFCDESAINEHSTFRRWGYSMRGTKACLVYDYNRSQKHSILPLLGINGFLAVEVVQSSYNEDSFKIWLEDVALPRMNPHPLPYSVLVMDNAPIHNEERIRALCTSHGVILLMLPPYSPDYNPIENAFGLLKRKLQSSHEGTLAADLPEAIIEASRACLNPSIVEGLYRGCSYAYANPDQRNAADLNWEALVAHQQRS